MTAKPPPHFPLSTTGEGRPFWSVMVPTYRPKEKYLRQALESVLQQDPGSEQMQIEVVDDCSPEVDVEAIVKSIAGARVEFSRNPRNLGLAGGWNNCIQRSRGQWVHILHQDDYLLPGFYERLAKGAQLHPEVSLLATRSLFVDAERVIIGPPFGVTIRLPNLENGGRVVDDFLYAAPVQCPGVVVRRSFYEEHGGFRSDLVFSLDVEMWARVISSAGGLVTPEALACYRLTNLSESGQLNRKADSLRDLDRLNQIFAGRYPEFDHEKARRQVCYLAANRADLFSNMGDAEAAKANLDYWRRHAPASLRLRRFAVKIARALFG